MIEVANAQIGPKELNDRLKKGEKVILLDIREPYELDICQLKYTLHLPMGELLERLDELEPHKNDYLVVYCRSGRRSARCVAFLREQGFARATNLQGGIIAWSDQVDPSLTKY